MNLVADIGNSSTKVAVFDGRSMVARLRTEGSPAGAFRELAEKFPLRHAVISVVGRKEESVCNTLKTICPDALFVTGTTPTPLRVCYDNPQTLGPDRLAAAVGAAALRPKTELLIIDIGTCLTFDRVSADGRYLGGNISPGLGIRFRALHEQTAALPLVTAEETAPQWGTDTVSAIRAGVMTGTEWEIEGCIRAFRKEFPDAPVFLTGGNARKFCHGIPVERQEALVETGLNEILLHHLSQQPQTD